MGLDISAYRQLRKLENPALDEHGEPVDWQNTWKPCRSIIIEWTEKNWPGRSAGVEPDGVFGFAEQFRFRAGSYGGYNEWRRELAALIGEPDLDAYWEQATSGPFYELLNFADNEGVIGPVASAKLARDFAEHDAKAADRGGWFYEQYRRWRHAFELAADGGAVDFH